MLIAVSDPSKTASLACAYLLTAYQTCGTETGMGFLQAVQSLDLSDIPKRCPPRPASPSLDPAAKAVQGLADRPWLQMHADYLAGRMVKAGIRFSEDGFVEIANESPNPSYQGWSSRLTSYLSLLEAAAAMIGVEIAPVT